MNLLQGKTILFVDDEEYLREVMSDWLGLAGATVITAASAQQGLEIAKQQRVDAILTDFRMPGKSGLWLIESVTKELDYQPKLFICSGFTELSGDELTKLPVDAIFGKPFDESKIIQAIASALVKPTAV